VFSHWIHDGTMRDCEYFYHSSLNTKNNPIIAHTELAISSQRPAQGYPENFGMNEEFLLNRDLNATLRYG